MNVPFAAGRYVEVKTRARSGAIRLSSDEPQLHRIPNPAAYFRVGESILATGYIIQEETRRERAGR